MADPDTSLQSAPETPPASESVRNKEREPRSEIVGGILISPSQAIKWVSRLCDMPLVDHEDGRHDPTALFHLKTFGRRNHADVCLVAQTSIYTPEGRFVRQPFMIITQKERGRFFRPEGSDDGCEEVMEEKIKMTPGATEKKVRKYLKAQGVEDLGFKTFFYQ